MKLRDLVANSLPRVRARKKKVAVAAGASSAESSTKLEVRPGNSSLDSSTSNPGAVVATQRASRDDSLEMQGISEASWRGNALYRGLEAARAVKLNSKMMSASYTSSHGMVTSHSADGVSSQLMMMSRSYDSRIGVPDWSDTRMFVPECNDSCPQMSSVSESRVEPFSHPQQYYHCHYHRHNHHHYHHHHLHSKPMIPVAQNQQQQQLCSHPSDGNNLASCKVPQEVKAEAGFFRKSLASLGGIRKYSSKSKKSAKQGADEKMLCSVCPYPEPMLASGSDSKSSDKRPAKPKRKNIKAFSKLKENKETVFLGDRWDSTWFSDNDCRSAPSRPIIGREDPPGFTAFDRCHFRERSVESCSSRLVGSRESSVVREVDLTGFDSASLSGYESDLPRGKVHRSRSRIKTNPWLPSPQPPVAGGTRGQHCDLHESREDIDVADELMSRLTRSSSFEHHRKVSMLPHISAHNHSVPDKTLVQRPRSLTPSDTKVTFSLSPLVKSLSGDVSPPWWSPSKDCVGSSGSRVAVSSHLNDLNTDVPKPRAASTISPNSEFVLLADNLEQLANNISFEYEDMLDTTLESVSICQEDGQASIHELLTDDENGSLAAKTFLKSDGDVHSAHSPDSGIGGIGSTDGDDVLTPNAQREQSAMPDECLEASARMVTADIDPNLEMARQQQHRRKTSDEFKCLPGTASYPQRHFDVSCSYNATSSPCCNRKQISLHDKRCELEQDSSATLSESDVDNTSYQDSSNSFVQTDSRMFQDFNNKPLQYNHHKCDNKCVELSSPGRLKHHNEEFLSGASQQQVGQCRTGATLMVNERLDIQVAPSHRQLLGSGLVMGSRARKHESGLGGFSKQMPGKVGGASATVGSRSLRPLAFRTSPRGQHAAGRMNDMEKGSSRSWSSEYDFPRNITVTECVESPTENWRCDEHFLAYCSQSGATIGSSDGDEYNSSTAGESFRNIELPGGDVACIRHEELVVRIHDCVTARESSTQHSPTSRNTRLEEYDICNPESVIFQMNDACVQTDFDEDFSKWDDTDTLDNLEDRTVDPAESTRLWLLTGNMQGSADTGYASLTRDSLVFMDEDSLLVAGELEERAAAERLSCGESSWHDNSGSRAYLADARLEVNSQQFLDYTGGHIPPQESAGVRVNDAQEILPEDALWRETNMVTESVCREQGVKTFYTGEKVHNATRAVPHHAILHTISSSDSQIRTHPAGRGGSVKALTTRSSSESSDRTLKFSDSDDLESDVQNMAAVKVSKIKDSETGETKVALRSIGRPLASIDYRNTQSEYSFRNATMQQGHSQTTDFLHNVRSQREQPCPLSGRDLCSIADLGHCSEVVPSSIVPGCERADYLEFLKDAPLNRSHLKRPLFLVPGLGPVDMSCSEQINLFAETGTSHLRSPLSNSPTVCTPLTPAMSPSAAHCGKKLKYKKGDQTTCAAGSNAGPDQLSKYVSPSLNHSFHAGHGEPSPQPSSLQYTQSVPSSSISCGQTADAIVPLHLLQSGEFKDASSANNSHPTSSTSSSSQSTTAVSTTGTSERSLEERKRKDEVTRSLRERVMSLRREKDVVFQRIREARQDDRARQEQRLQVQGHMRAHRKEALLETLHELRHKLEAESELLKMNENT